MTSKEDVGPSVQALCFAPFRLDLVNEQLWRGTQPLEVRPKTFAVLRYLVEHPNRLVTRDELCQAVWPETVGSERAPKQCIRELRQVLGEKPTTPQFIETIARRGWRFLGNVVRSPQAGDSSQEEEGQKAKRKTQKPALSPSTTLRINSVEGAKIEDFSPAPTVVGRDTELAQLHAWLDQSLQGSRQMVFVTGEPGIGKTTLVDVFLQTFASRSQARDLRLLLGRGQCVEQYGAGEAFLPILDALGRLCREPEGEPLIAVLRQHAPTWLTQMPALLSATELETLQRQTAGATQGRMLRELVEALETFTAESPLVLWLEDLHWSDPSTVTLLSLLARRSDPAHLLVIGSCRPEELQASAHPLHSVMQDLRAHHLCQVLALSLLTEEAVADYICRRFPISVTPVTFARTLHHRTGGHPFFLVSLLEELRAQQILTHVDGTWGLAKDLETVAAQVPESVQQLMGQQQARLQPAEQRVLEAASLAGQEFAVAAVAAALASDVSEVGEQCAQLTRRQQFIAPAGIAEWPDGSVTTRYHFQHALYQQLWHERIALERRQQWHLRIGERLEAAYGRRRGEIAAELALHFIEGRDNKRAIQYLQQAGKLAARRNAYEEAARYLTKALDILTLQPETPERIPQELELYIALGSTLMTYKSYAAPEVEQTYAHALNLCRRLGKSPRLFQALSGLTVYYLTRGALRTARTWGEQCLSLARDEQSSERRLLTLAVLGNVLFYEGEFVLARDRIQEGLRLYEQQSQISQRALQDPGVNGASYLALLLWCLGYPEQAVQSSEAALTRAQQQENPLNEVIAWVFGACLYQLQGEAASALTHAERAVALASQQHFPLWGAYGLILQGWALAMQGQGEEGIRFLRQGMANTSDMGADVAWSWFLLMFAEICVETNRSEEGLTAVREAFESAQKRSEGLCLAELHRLKGELILQQSRTNLEQVSDKPQVSPKTKVQGPKSSKTNSLRLTPNSHAEAEAEGCFLTAIEIARQQQAKSWELRASTSLARLWQRQGKQQQAHKMLSDVYNWFTEGFDTKDLQEAKTLLAELEK